MKTAGRQARLLAALALGLLASAAPAAAGAAELPAPSCAEGAAISTDGTTIVGSPCSERIIVTDPRVKRILGGNGDDVIYANPNVLEVDGGGGNDVIYGEPPEIELGFEPSDEEAAGQPPVPGGPVYRRAGAKEVPTYRFAAPDRRSGGAAASAVVSCDEVNPCYGGIGSQLLKGGPDNDVIFGQRGNDEIYGNEGNDALYGGIGDEKLISGGQGEDLLSGGPGSDLLNGNQESDLVRGDATIDVIRDTGPTGADTISFATAVAPGFDGGVSQSGFPGAGDDEERGVHIRLDGGEVCAGPAGPLQACNGAARYGGGNDEVQIIETRGFENVIGSPFADVIEGDGNSNRLEGGGGADVLIGNGGNDVLVGGAEGDYLQGGSGTDSAFGEAGADNCAADVESPSGCSGSEAAVVQRDRSTISAGLMTAAFASSVHWTQLYLVGADSGRDNVSVNFWIDGGGTGHVTFTAAADSAPFNQSGEASTANCTYAEREVDCALAAPPDVLTMAGMEGNDHLSVAGSGLSDTTSVVLLGGEGNDYLQGGGTTEDVLVDGTGAGADDLRGYSYDDFLTNNSGADSVQGGAGNDLILSAETCTGATLNGATASGDDGPAQNSTSWAKLPAPDGVVADLQAGTAGSYWSNGPACPAGLDSLVYIDDLEGSNQSDALYGDGNDNNMLGRPGEDSLFGRGGEDRIEAKDGQHDSVGGGEGTDKCFWDLGVDELSGCDVETVTYASSPDRVLNGQPGFVTSHGFAKYVPTDTNQEKSLGGVTVHVKFAKWNGAGWEYQWQVAATTASNGRYEVVDKAIGAGKWRLKGVLYPQGTYLKSESGWHVFEVKKGYRLRPKHSNKCMSVSENKRANGVGIIQWDCAAVASPGDGQVFTFVPIGNNFNIVANGSNNLCVDVSGASAENGTPLQLWECNGAGQTNQVWQRVGIAGDSPYVGFIAQHSGKCADVLGKSQGNGAVIDQWECYWGNNQRWLMEEVG